MKETRCLDDIVEAEEVIEPQPPQEVHKIHTVHRKNSKYVPQVEKPVHREMFAYYASLGKNRNLQKVAKQFGKSVELIAAISRAFSWQNRIKLAREQITDPLLIMIKDKVDATRKNLVSVVMEVVDTMSEMVQISRTLKEDGKMTQELADRSVVLNQAMRVFGIEITNPKDMKDLILVLKEITKFNESTGKETKEINPQQNVEQATQINIAKLVIKDD
jgi:hypothetical protein